jgi:ParB-like chromosome segregation protein Spo0J
MKKENNTVVDLPIDLIEQHSSYPRVKTPEEIRHLLDSIPVNGQQMSITATQRDEKYIVVDGNTRLEACKALYYTTIKKRKNENNSNYKRQRIDQIN